MNYTEFLMFTGKISSEYGSKGEEFRHLILALLVMLDETDQDDYFGTQGWKYHFGWEE